MRPHVNFRAHVKYSHITISKFTFRKIKIPRKNPHTTSHYSTRRRFLTQKNELWLWLKNQETEMVKNWFRVLWNCLHDKALVKVGLTCHLIHQCHFRDDLPSQSPGWYKNPVFSTNHLPDTSKQNVTATKLQHKKLT